MHCARTKYGNYSSLVEAQLVCDVDYNCEWVYDDLCDDSGVFYLCPAISSWSDLELGDSESSCVYRKGIFNIGVVFSKSTTSKKATKSNFYKETIIFFAFIVKRTVPPKECLCSQFTCNDGKCIDLNQRCDGHSDCNDSSDETRCDGRNERVFCFLRILCVKWLYETIK